MHIARYIEEQKRLNPEPRHWWERKSVWYTRLIFMATIAVDVGLCLLTISRRLMLPESFEAYAGLANVLTLFVVSMGFLAAFFGFMFLSVDYRRNDTMTHRSGITWIIALVLIMAAFFPVVNHEIENGVALHHEQQQLEAKLQTGMNHGLE